MQDLIAQGCDPKKVQVARLGVEKPNNAINPFNESKTRTIVTCSNIVGLKRLDLLIAALSQIDDKSIHWVHFGDGIQRDSIEQLASKQLSGKSNIQYTFKGSVPVQTILDFYGSVSVDCFINCSDVEGIPVSIMEAMSYGIPCIARNVGGNSEIVFDSVNGFLLPGDCSAAQLAQCIIRVLELKEEERSLVRDRAVETYQTYYNAKKNHTQFWAEIVKWASNDIIR